MWVAWSREAKCRAREQHVGAGRVLHQEPEGGLRAPRQPAMDAAKLHAVAAKAARDLRGGH